MYTKEKIIQDLNDKVDRNSLDETLLFAFQAGRDKILKHYKLCNWVYSAVLILHPRHKTKSFSVTKWGKELENESIKKFKAIFKKDYYAKFVKEDEIQDMPSKRRKLDEGLLDFQSVFCNQNCDVDRMNEIDMYLNAPCANENVNVLHWWRDHEYVFPILSKMAKDYMSIMATSVPVERFFSNTSLIMPPRRRKLNDDIFTALSSISSWVKSDLVFEICGFNPNVDNK